MSTPESDIIKKGIFVRAPRSRVWRAITTEAEFAKWFSVEIDGAFKLGAKVRMTSTHEVAKGQVFYIYIRQMEKGRLFSWQWYPGTKGRDDESEPMTTVVFQLEDVEGGTRVTVTESGFAALSPEIRARAFEGNTQGWEIQTQSLSKYVSQE